MTTRRYELSGQNVVNVKYYGAKGDGVTNDRVAIQNAINAAWGAYPNTNGGTGVFSNRSLYFPRGHYIIDAPLMIVDMGGGNIFGDGKLVTIIENVSTSTATNNDPWRGSPVDTHFLHYPQRSVISCDGFSFSSVKGMTLKCAGGICFSSSWCNRSGTTVNNQHNCFDDMRFDCGGVADTGVGVAAGFDAVPSGGIAAVLKTGNLSNGSNVITNIATTADLDVTSLWARVTHTPFVPGGDGIPVDAVVTSKGANSVTLSMPATVTASNVPILFGHQVIALCERHKFSDCEFIGCGCFGVACGNANSLQHTVNNCYFDSCGYAIVNVAGSFPVVSGCRFHNSTYYDYRIDNSYTSYGDTYIVAGCYSDSLNFAFMHAGPRVNLSAVVHDNPNPGNFCFIEAGYIGTACVDACYSRNGNFTGNGKVYGRGNTWQRSGGPFVGFGGTYTDI